MPSVAAPRGVYRASYARPTGGYGSRLPPPVVPAGRGPGGAGLLAAILGPIGGLTGCLCCLNTIGVWGLFITAIPLTVFISKLICHCHRLSPSRCSTDPLQRLSLSLASRSMVSWLQEPHWPKRCWRTRCSSYASSIGARMFVFVYVHATLVDPPRSNGSVSYSVCYSFHTRTQPMAWFFCSYRIFSLSSATLRIFLLISPSCLRLIKCLKPPTLRAISTLELFSLQQQNLYDDDDDDGNSCGDIQCAFDHLFFLIWILFCSVLFVSSLSPVILK